MRGTMMKCRSRMEVRKLSRRKNGTNRTAVALGLNPYGWGNGKARKRPRELRTPVGQIKNNSTDNIAQIEGGCKDGKCN